MPPLKLQPQIGPQELFHKSSADIAIYGGAAGAGKTWSLLAEPLRHLNVSGFSGSIFRKTNSQIEKLGGLWDASQEIYPSFGGFGIKRPFRYRFKNNVKISLENLQYDSNLSNFDGAQIAYIGFDELIQFSQRQFFHLVGRNRSLCGISPYIRATTNPDPDSWVKKLIDWYLLPSGDFADPTKAGVIRHFIRLDGEIIWGHSREDLKKTYKDKAAFSKTFTFIPGLVTDNRILLDKNPEYLSNLESLQLVQRERLLHGNWKIRESAGNLFRREWVELIESAPTDLFTLRYWDLAGTDKKSGNDPDFTVGLKIGISGRGEIFILDVIRFQGNPFKVENAILNTATLDGCDTHIIVEHDPGQAGVFQVKTLIAKIGRLGAYRVGVNHPTTSKISRFAPFSCQAEAGNVKVLRRRWTEDYLSELDNFPPENGKGHDDICDANSGAYTMAVEISKIIK